MLVLSRRHGETIRIHDRVTVTVVAIRGNRVQLGIEAPADVCIRRSELPGGREPAQPGHEAVSEPPLATTA